MGLPGHAASTVVTISSLPIDEIRPCISPFGSLRGPNPFPTDLSCKGRGICASCNTRRMVETAAHMVDEVFAQVPVRQWVLSFPKRLRYFLVRDAGLLNRALRIFLNSIEKALQSCCADAPDGARLGAVTFVHRFGSALNGNIHSDEIHPCISPFGSLRGPNLLPADLSLLRDRWCVQCRR